MAFCNKDAVRQRLQGKTVALVGSGPGSMDNELGFVDLHDVVCRVNNYKMFPQTGFRTDVHYSFYGSSIRKTAEELKRDGVSLCMCKCPDAKFIESVWHAKNGKTNGVDFRYIYRQRKNWWFCETYIPSLDEFLVNFHLLGDHVPTTGFSALLDILSYEPASVYLTGFDFFESGFHNVNEPWRVKNEDDPIGHDPQAERAWLAENLHRFPITLDKKLKELFQ